MEGQEKWENRRPFCFLPFMLGEREAGVQPTLGALNGPAAQVGQWKSRNR